MSMVKILSRILRPIFDHADTVAGSDKFHLLSQIVVDLYALHQSLDILCGSVGVQTYPVVSAASIVAKVLRDRSIGELSWKYGPVGSGYCSDPRTIEFLKRWFERTGGFPRFTRTTWSTCLRISREAGPTVRPREPQD